MAEHTPASPRKSGALFRRRLLISALLGAIPLFLLGIGLLLDRYNSRRSMILQNNLTQASLSAVYVQGWLDGHLRTLRTLAESNEVQSGNVVQVNGLVHRQLHAQAEWTDLVVANTAGQEIAGTAHLTDISGSGYFQQTRQTLRPVVSNLLFSLTNGQPVIVIAYPVLRGNAFRGLIAADISPTVIQRVFSQVSIPEGTVLSLWGSDCRLIAATATAKATVGTACAVADQRIFSRTDGAEIAVSPLTHQHALIGYAQVHIAPWTVTTDTPLAVAIGPVYTNLAIFLVLSLLVLGISLAWSIYSADAIARQVSLLADSARAIGEGDYATRVVLHSGDELEDLANSLNKAAAELAVADRLKYDLINMVSHELKTPLTSIRATLDVLASGMVTPDHPRYRELLEIAERQSRRLQDMIENLISVARMEAGGFSVTPRPTALSSIIDLSVAQYAELAHERGLAFTTEVQPDISVLADATKVTLALNNLLDNAIKFTEHGGITLRAYTEDGEAVVTVTDTGRGISSEVRSQLFQKFYQAEPLLTRKAGGAGLGLLVVKSIIEAHGGRMIVESEGPGRGSTFGFTLPLA